MLYLLIAALLIFDFINGSNDSSNIVATVISSRALRPRVALLITAAAEFIAPFLFGVAVANTLGNGLIKSEAITLNVVFAAALAAMIWILVTRFIGIPSSSSHALVGGLLGAAILTEGLAVVQLDGLFKILLALFISPLLGLLFGFLLMAVVLFLSRNSTPRINSLFRRLQILTLLSLALSYGSNDSQKTMGIITLGLVASGVQENFHVPLWVITASASAIALGTTFGGWRLIRTLGGRIFKIRPVHAFTSQLASAGVILGAAMLGGPVSTTQVISSSIIGVGAAERFTKVRWIVAKEMLIAWVLTIPLTAIVSVLIYLTIVQFVSRHIFQLALNW